MILTPKIRGANCLIYKNQTNTPHIKTGCIYFYTFAKKIPFKLNLTINYEKNYS